MAYYGYINPNVYGPKKPKQYDFSLGSDELPNPYQGDTPVTAQAEPERDFAAEYQKAVMQPDGPNTSKYMEYMAKGGPKEDDYRLGKAGRLGAILAASAATYGSHGDLNKGLALGDHILHDPYNRALAEYERTGKDLRGAADIEGASQTRQTNRLKAALDAKDKAEDNRRLAQSAQWTAKNIQSQIESRKAQGWHYSENAKDGSMDATKINPDGTVSHMKIPVGHLTEEERAAIRGQAAVATAEAIDPILTHRARLLQNASFGHADAQQQRQFAHAEKMAAGKSGPNQSVTQVQAKNSGIVSSIVQGDPKKYNTDVYGLDPATGTWEIKNPLAEKGFPRVNPDDPNSDIDWTQLTPKEISDYNAFVELHNANIDGIDNSKKLKKIAKPTAAPKGKIERKGFDK